MIRTRPVQVEIVCNDNRLYLQVTDSQVGVMELDLAEEYERYIDRASLVTRIESELDDLILGLSESLVADLFDRSPDGKYEEE